MKKLFKIAIGWWILFLLFFSILVLVVILKKTGKLETINPLLYGFSITTLGAVILFTGAITMRVTSRIIDYIATAVDPKYVPLFQQGTMGFTCIAFWYLLRGLAYLMSLVTSPMVSAWLGLIGSGGAFLIFLPVWLRAERFKFLGFFFLSFFLFFLSWDLVRLIAKITG